MNNTKEKGSGLLKSGLPCWKDDCQSSDAVSIYAEDEPHLICFSCESQTWDEDIVDEYLTLSPTPPKPSTSTTGDEYTPYEGMILPLTDRGISKETAEKYNVQTLFDGDKKQQGRSFPFTDDKGTIIACKNKTTDGTKKMFSRGPISRAVLFGQSAFPKGGKYITITEGEEDAMAAHQMLSKGKYESAVVSIKNGAQSALRDCDQSFEYIDSFDNVIICFDMDEPGQKAAQKVAKKFIGKSKIMKMDRKDANEYLTEGRQDKFTNAWWNAEKVSVKGVHAFGDLWDEMTKEDTSTKVPYPWEDMESKLYGMRTSELSIIKAKPKLGKTQVLREIAYHIQETTDHNIGIIFLEESIKRIAQGFTSLAMEKPMHLPTTQYTKKEEKEAFDKVAVKDQLHIFDPRSERTANNLFDKLRYFVQALGCKYILLDHISMFAYSDAHGDERRFLDKFVSDLSDFATKYDVHIMAVMHVNDEGKTRGSRAPVQLCNVMMTLERDKQNPNPKIANTTTIIVDEDRFAGYAGIAVKLFYDEKTGRMTPIDDDLDLDEDLFSDNLLEVEFKDD
jgi:twinkle protein